MDDPVPENSGHSATIIFILLVVTTVSICNSVMTRTTFVKVYVPLLTPSLSRLWESKGS